MKKLVLALLVAALATAGATAVSAADPLELEAPKATVKIDGVKDAGYGQAYKVETFKDDSKKGATGLASFAWDDDYLYLYIEVNDTTPNHDHKDTWHRDCIEWFIDWDNIRTKGDKKNGGHPYYQVRVASAPTSDGKDPASGGDVSGIVGEAESLKSIKYVVKPLKGDDLANGYIVEVAVPARADYKTSTGEGKVIGTDIQIGDNQKGEGRVSQAFLGDISGNKSTVDKQSSDPSANSANLKLVAAKKVVKTTEAAQTSDVSAAVAAIAMGAAAAGITVAKKRSK